jgi:CubicO group peptidase (beta-lactamase class C family)
MALSDIQAILDRAVADGAAPGLTAAVATPQGDAHFAAGVRGVDDPTPMRPDDVFWIASCTKAIASAAALQLVERGLADLDAPLGALIPALARPKVLDGFDADGTPRLRPARAPVTLRALLTHTSGLAYDFFSPDLTRYYAAAGGSLLASATTDPVLAFDPGASWQYGIGIDAAGWLVEAVTGATLADYLAEHILGPLGMADTAFPAATPAERLVGMHARGPDGGFVTADRFPDSPTFHGGGGLNSTAPDYLKFLRAVMAANGAGVFGPATRAALREPAARVGAPGDLTTAAPPLSHDFRPMPGTPKTWTLGFLRNEAHVPGGRRSGSLAWGGLANCYYWADPESGVAGALFAQFLPFADPKALDVFAEVERAAYAG